MKPGRAILLVAVWFALTAGLAEASVLVFRRLVLHEFIWSSRHILWMAPVAYLAFFGAPAAGIALATRVIPGLGRPWSVAGVAAGCAFVATGCLLRLIGLQRIHVAAITVAAAGVAVQTGRLFAAGRGIGLVRRSVPWLVAAVVLLGGGPAIWWAILERRALAALPAAGAGAPNILLLILDTVRAASLGLYGYPRSTSPSLDAFARRGVTFDRAISPAPWTLPSHAAMFTGRWPHELSTGFLRPLDATPPTLAERLRDRGYRTAGFVANEFYTSYQTGLARGFVHFEDFRLTPKQVLLSAELGQLLSDWRSKLLLRTNDPKPAPIVNARFLRWARAPDRRPFFAFLNYMDAHVPYHTPGAVERRFQGSGNAAADRYDAAIAYLDGALGSLFHELEVRGLLANTVVIVASDHGEQVGEHGLDDHGNSLFLQLLHVPLVIVAPAGVPAGRRVTDPASLRDLAATILAFAGATDSGGSLPGRPLQRLWTTTGAGDSLLLAEVDRHPTGPARWPNRKGPMRALFQGPWHYIRDSDGREQLYDYWADPAEARDLAGTAAGAALLPPLRAALDHM